MTQPGVNYDLLQKLTPCWRLTDTQSLKRAARITLAVTIGGD